MLRAVRWHTCTCRAAPRGVMSRSERTCAGPQATAVLRGAPSTPPTPIPVVPQPLLDHGFSLTARQTRGTHGITVQQDGNGAHTGDRLILTHPTSAAIQGRGCPQNSGRATACPAPRPRPPVASQGGSAPDVTHVPNLSLIPRVP